ncbi:predicted protein [Sclerotinia sclerotiorum 1980 UF-70]|uniref:Uncharacterized protein n=1 Tax=Sclerotinia sclerotiorum (strain ATCC 18683 / 1980 / Ss-1) TaxID=665079 RepID=A7E4S8_SCLS1|nr:predicted protein [Sclerotinia sclerotiorum 1980 UF-70]EDN90900.1 predicted protein [Sclerotinia sclerotiorum 1980 UF-70]
MLTSSILGYTASFSAWDLGDLCYLILILGMCNSHRREFAEVKDKPFLILYTPGSTGIPKPAHVNLCSFAANAAYQLVPSLRGKPTMVNYM